MKFIRKKAVLDLVGMSATTLWREEREGRFPLRRRISKSSVAWIYEEIIEWMKSREQALNLRGGTK